MKQRFLSFSFLFALSALISSSVDAYISKDFLTKIDQRFLRYGPTKESLSVLTAAGTSSEEFMFLESLKDKEIEDLYLPAKSAGADAFSYNILTWRKAKHVLDDRRHKSEKECKKIMVDEDGSFHEFRYHITNKVPKKGKSKVEKGWYFSYCVGADTVADKNSIIYFFHGASGSPSNWKNRKAIAEIRRLWREEAALPRWVSVSMGRFSTLLDKDSEAKFFEIVVSYIEKQMGIKPGAKIKRFGLGVSMGGANVAQALLLNRDFFTAAFLACPAVSSIDVTNVEERKALKARTNAWSLVLKMAAKMLPKPLRDQGYYSSVDPLIIGQELLSKKTPPMYIQTNSQDEFGLNEGGRLFALLARAKGADVQFEELEGGHCVLNSRAAMAFLRKFQ